MDTPEPRRPLLGRLRRALLGARAGTIGSAARNVDSLATFGHQGADADADADADGRGRQDGAPRSSGQ